MDIEDTMDKLYYFPLRKSDDRLEVAFETFLHPASFMFDNNLNGMQVRFTEIVDNEQ